MNLQDHEAHAGIWLYLQVGWDEAEVEKLEGHPELPVCNDSCLPVLLQLALYLVGMTLVAQQSTC